MAAVTAGLIMRAPAPLEMGSTLLSCWSQPALAHRAGSASIKPHNFGSTSQVKRFLGSF